MTAARATIASRPFALDAMPLPARSLLADALDSPASWTGALDAPAIVRATLDALNKLDVDADTILAAVLHAVPNVASAIGFRPADKANAAIAALLDGQRAAGQVWTLHAEHGGAKRSEGLRRLLLAIVRDLRVVPILLSRQLARMQALFERNSDVLATSAEARELALLTRDIHAPLANRLGVWQLKWELEDLAFRTLEPETYLRIARLLDEKRTEREEYIEAVKVQLRDALRDALIEADVDGRPKHIYSIHRKMQRKAVPIGELYDLRAVRVLVSSVADCYAALGVVHAQWTPVSSEFDDYIARPKRNDYRSLHTAVIGPQGKTLEVQIRTHDMHHASELGVAAHWRYKEGGSAAADAAFDRKVTWMRRLLDAGGEGQGDAALAGELDTELLEDRVYVLTPKGEVVDLPTGATPLDFAYHVHTEVGHRCRGAKVDGRIVPLDHVLHSGDRVEIMTAKTGEPRRDWLVQSNGFLASSRSREKVRNWFNRLDRERNESAGRDMLDKELRRLGLLHVDLAPARAKFNSETDTDLYVHVALGDVGPHQVGRALLEHERAQSQPVAPAPAKPAPARRREASSALTVQGVGNLLVQLARCCQPVPGEPITGYLTRGRGVSVHRVGCATFERLASTQPQRALPVEWGRAGGGHEIDVEVTAIDRKWLLKDVTNVIAQSNTHVGSIRSDTDRGGTRMRLTMRLRVGDYGQLSALLGKLAALPGVERAQRA